MARALLLPDLAKAPDRLIKTLSIYWDGIVIPTYLERAGNNGPLTDFRVEESDVSQALAGAGVVTHRPRTAILPPADLSDLPEELKKTAALSDAAARLTAGVAPLIGADVHDKEAFDTVVEEMGERMLSYMAKQYLGRVQDAFELAGDLSLAPIASSPVSHVASFLGVEAGVPRAEATMLSAVITSFEIDPETPVDRIIEFREKNSATLGRFRASVIDLSEGLNGNSEPTRLLAEARDRYRNRVVPALGDLEAALKGGKIRFFLKSLIGASALSLAPVRPVKAIEGGAALAGQTINYAFSREKLVREHPFGYLHQVSTGGLARVKSDGLRALESAVRDPESEVRSMFNRELKGEALEALPDFWFSPDWEEKLKKNLESDLTD